MKNEITIKLNYQHLETLRVALLDATENLNEIYDGFKTIDDQKRYPFRYKNFIDYSKLSKELDKCFEKCLWGGEYVIK